MKGEKYLVILALLLGAEASHKHHHHHRSLNNLNGGLVQLQSEGIFDRVRNKIFKEEAAKREAIALAEQQAQEEAER